VHGDGLYQGPLDPRSAQGPLHTHTLATIGMIDVEPWGAIMVLRVLLGEHQFELRMELEKARGFLAGVQRVVDELERIHAPDV